MVMNVQTRLILVFVIAIVLASTSNSFAAMYQYTDKYGIVSFANDLQSIPEQSRATAKIVSGEQEQEAKPAPQKLAPVQEETRKSNAESSSDREKVSLEGTAKNFFSGKVLISIVVVVSALFAFVILGILDADHKKSIRIVRVVIVWGMSVYLIVAHGGDVVNMFRTVKGNVDAVQHESEEKGKKAAKAIKEMNAIIQHVDDAASQDPGAGAAPEKRD
jgi:Skp family chaperone for outer membrane proteins